MARCRSSCVVENRRGTVGEKDAAAQSAAEEGGRPVAHLLSSEVFVGERGSRRAALSSRRQGLGLETVGKAGAQVRAGVDSGPAWACKEALAHGVVGRQDDVAAPGEEGGEARRSEEGTEAAAAGGYMAQAAARVVDEAGEDAVGAASTGARAAGGVVVDGVAVRRLVTTSWCSRDGGVCCQAAPEDPCLIYMYIRTNAYEKTRDEAKIGSGQIRGGEGGGHGKAMGNGEEEPDVQFRFGPVQ